MTIENYSIKDVEVLVSRLKSLTYFMCSGESWPAAAMESLREEQCDLVERLESAVNLLTHIDNR